MSPDHAARKPSVMDTEADQLESALLEAHERGDTRDLVELYEQAAELKARMEEPDAAAFLYTQAYVFALESGHERVTAIRQILISLGRETPDDETIR